MLSTFSLKAQQNSFDIALSYGLYNAPLIERQVSLGRRETFLERAQSKTFLAADFEYRLPNNWIISTGFLEGRFAYVEDVRTYVVSYPSDLNGTGYESHLYIAACYSMNYRKN